MVHATAKNARLGSVHTNAVKTISKQLQEAEKSNFIQSVVFHISIQNVIELSCTRFVECVIHLALHESAASLRHNRKKNTITFNVKCRSWVVIIII